WLLEGVFPGNRPRHDGPGKEQQTCFNNASYPQARSKGISQRDCFEQAPFWSSRILWKVWRVGNANHRRSAIIQDAGLLYQVALRHQRVVPADEPIVSAFRFDF